jgi:D-alanine transfer protein
MIGPHLRAALIAAGLLVSGLYVGAAYVRELESRAIHSLAPAMFTLKNQGSELQAEAFQQSDLVVVYGSSELEMANPYHASDVFQAYPSGFTIFPVGRGLTTTLVMLQDVAAIGPELRNKKVVISVSPPWFFLHDRTPEFYAPNYSRLHLSALVFSTDLSFETKQAAVRQVLESTKMVHQDPLIGFAADRLVSDAWFDQALYAAALPLGKLQNLVLQVQDLWETCLYLQAHQAELASSPPKQAATLDWASLGQQAEREQASASDSNPFGFDNGVWVQKYNRLVPEREAQFDDASFADNLQHTAEWTDLDLLLKGLTELGAQPLVLSQPIPGEYYDYIGISQPARMEYYARLRAVAARYAVPVVDFADHDDDVYFVTDPNSHLSRKGWVYYDQALDAFFQGTLGTLAATEWSAGGVLPPDSARADLHVR